MATTSDEKMPSEAATGTNEAPGTSTESSEPRGSDTPTSGSLSATSGPTPEQLALFTWTRNLQEAFTLARAEHLNRLKGTSVSLLDKQGMHPFSVCWGEVVACELLFPDLTQLRFEGGHEPCDPLSLRREARLDAERAHTFTLIERHREEQNEAR